MHNLFYNKYVCICLCMYFAYSHTSAAAPIIVLSVNVLSFIYRR